MPDSSLTSFDASLADACEMTVLEGGKVKFQFAPRITNESNSSLWLEKDTWSIEPLRIHRGSSGRKLNMEWEYVATDTVFTGSAIASEIRKLKTYFFEFKRARYPVVEVKYTHVIPKKTPFRMRDLQVTYGPELVESGGDNYPLYSKVAIQLELATTVAGKAQGQKDKVVVPPLVKSVVPEWY